MLPRSALRPRFAARHRSASIARALGALLVAATFSSCTSDGGSGGPVAPLPGGTISLSLTPSSVTLAPGATGGVGLTVTRTGSFAGAVALSASGVPAGVNLTFGSSTVSPSAVSTSVNLVIAGSAAPGTTEISIIGSGSGVTSPATKLTLRIQ